MILAIIGSKCVWSCGQSAMFVAKALWLCEVAKKIGVKGGFFWGFEKSKHLIQKWMIKT
jgi:hypothetical protein